MNEKQFFFIIQSRVGSALNISFEDLKKESNCELVLIADPAVIKEVHARQLTAHFYDILTIDDKFNIQEIISQIDSCLEQLSLVNHRPYFDIMTTNESKVLLCGELKQHYGLTTEDYGRFVYKDKMKDLAKQHHIKTPAYLVIDLVEAKAAPQIFSAKVEDTLGYPSFIKPVNMFASLNCIKINNKQELLDWLCSVEINGLVYEIEEFIEGKLFLCDAIVKDGEMEYSQICQYSIPCFDMFKNDTIGWMTISEKDEIYQQAMAFTEQVNRTFMNNLNGVTHLEFFQSDGELIFLEIAYRPIGIAPTEFYMKRAGIPLREAHFRIQQNPSLSYNRKNSNYVALVVINFPQQAGVLLAKKSLHLNSHFEVEWFCDIGDEVPENNGFNGYAGKLLLWNPDFDILKKDFDMLRTFSPLIIKNQNISLND